MATIRVSDEKLIARPIDVVRAQFVDMAHHAATRVHASLEVSNVRPQQGGCRVTNRKHVMGRVMQDEVEVLRHADGNSTLRSLSGANAGLVITQNFESVDAQRTRVKTTVALPVTGLRSLLAPLVRMGLQRDLATALEEDRVDLEERGYTPPA